MYHRTGVILALPLVALLAVLLAWPLAILGVDSFRRGSSMIDPATGSRAPAGWTPGNYAAVVRDPLYRRALVNSLWLSGAVACASTALCLPPAWLLARHRFPGRRALRAVLALPMSLAGVIVGFLTILMLGRSGVVPALVERATGWDGLAGVGRGMTGLLLAYVYFEIPRATLTLEAALGKLDPALDAAARTLGAARWQRARWVTLPLLRPALAATLAVTFAASLGSFGVALVLADRFSVLPLEIHQELTAFLNNELAAAMAVVLVLIALAANAVLLRDRAGEGGASRG